MLREEQYEFTEQQRTMKPMQQTDDEPSQPGKGTDDNENTDNSQVGAFAIAGIGGESFVDVSYLSGNTEARTDFTTQDSTLFPVLHARVVDEESPSLSAGPIIEAKPMEETDLTERHHLKALFKSRNCRIILILAVALFVGMIVAVVMFTQNGSKAATTTTSNATQAPQSDSSDIAANTFMAELKPLLSNASLTALEDTYSPQSQSLQWLLERSNFQDWSFQQQVQRYAMATIYYAVLDTSWSNSAGNWLTNETECRWFQGSDANSCGENDSSLQSLHLSSNSLNGKIPDEIRLLSLLTSLDLSMNQISGTVPSALGSLTALTSLSLENNEFSQTVPSELGSLKALTTLSLGGNAFTGVVPSELGSLKALMRLGLGGNSLTGFVPSELGSLTALTLLYLDDNAFRGTLPSECGSLTALTFLALEKNAFTGTLLSDLGSMTELMFLHLHNNFFEGTVSSELGSLRALTSLTLENNGFTGTLPSQLGSLTNSIELNLSNNNFTGIVPWEFGNLTALDTLYLYGNSLNGTVPVTLCNDATVTIEVDCTPGPQCSCCECYQP